MDIEQLSQIASLIKDMGATGLLALAIWLYFRSPLCPKCGRKKDGSESS